MDYNTSSIGFPNMFDVARNCVGVMNDTASIVNRCKLLILTEPTELYMNVDFGVGLKRHLFQYNSEKGANQKAIFRDKLVDQLNLHEPCVIPEETQIADGLLFTGTSGIDQKYNQMNMTVALSTKFGDTVNMNIDIEQLQNSMFNNV